MSNAAIRETSAARVEANRRNAQRSTGPRTPEGKARAALNAVSHGLRAVRPLTFDEPAETFEAISRQLRDEWRPGSVLEVALIEQIAELLWRRRRVVTVEAQLLEATERRGVFGAVQAPPDVNRTLCREMREPQSAIMRVQLYQMRIDRATHRALAELRRLQIDRQARDEQPMIEAEALTLGEENEQTNPTPGATDGPAGACERDPAAADALVNDNRVPRSGTPRRGALSIVGLHGGGEGPTAWRTRPWHPGVDASTAPADPSPFFPPATAAGLREGAGCHYHRRLTNESRIMATVDQAVILARGLGTRMRQADESATLDEATAKIAASGVKAMIPTMGRPFLDFVLSKLADSGYRRACLVIGPEHDAVREYYGKTLKTSRIEIDFAVQEKPLGTADAVRPAERFAAGAPFLMINSDNFYPDAALAALHAGRAPGIAVFERDAMLRGSNIAADRISKFSVVRINADGTMKQIIEKPDAATLAGMGDAVFVSMNCWCFTANIFKAAAAIPQSPRGEYEITDAAQYCIDRLGEQFRVHTIAAPVLDLSSRGDIAAVTDRLREVTVRL